MFLTELNVEKEKLKKSNNIKKLPKTYINFANSLVKSRKSIKSVVDPHKAMKRNKDQKPSKSVPIKKTNYKNKEINGFIQINENSLSNFDQLVVNFDQENINLLNKVNKNNNEIIEKMNRLKKIDETISQVFFHNCQGNR